MNYRDCEEAREAFAARGDRGDRSEIDGALVAHARSCPSCAEELGVARWLRVVARETPPRPLPSASQLWWKAQIIRRLVEQESLTDRATRPLRLTQWISLGILSVVFTLIVSWLASSFLGDLDLAALPTGASDWRWLLGLFLFGTVLPVLGLGTLWMLWRNAW